MTLIELLIVIAVLGILLVVAMPGYRSFMLRVHRTEAIGALLQASMCQQRLHASSGVFDTGRCQMGSDTGHYRINYKPEDHTGQDFIVFAQPRKSQLADPCGTLSLDQDGARTISAKGITAQKCWNGR